MSTAALDHLWRDRIESSTRSAVPLFIGISLVLNGWRFLLGPYGYVRLHDQFHVEWPRFINEANDWWTYGPQAWLPAMSGGMPVNVYHSSQLHPWVLAHVVFPAWAVFDFILCFNWLVAAYGLFRLLAINFGASRRNAFFLALAYASMTQAYVPPTLSYEFGFPLVVSLLHAPGRRVALSVLAIAFMTAISYPILHGPTFMLGHALLFGLMWFRGGFAFVPNLLISAIYWTGYWLAFVPNFFALLEYLPYSHRTYTVSTFADWRQTLAYFPIASAQQAAVILWAYALPGAFFGALAVARWRRDLIATVAATVLVVTVCTFFTSSLVTLLGDSFVRKLDLNNLVRMLPHLLFLVVALALEGVALLHWNLLRFVVGAAAGYVLIALTDSPKELSYGLVPLAGIAVAMMVGAEVWKWQVLPWRRSAAGFVVVVSAGIVLACGAILLGFENKHQYAKLYSPDPTFAAMEDESRAGPFRSLVVGLEASSVQMAGLETVDGRSPVFDRNFREIVALVPRQRATTRTGQYWTNWENLLLAQLVEFPFSAAAIRLPVLAAMNVRYIVSDNPLPGLTRAMIKGRDYFERPKFIYEVPDHMARGRWASDARLVERAADALNLLAALPDESWRSVAVLTKADGAPDDMPQGKGDCGTSVLTAQRPDRLAYSLVADRACLFLVANNFHHRWKASLNEEPVPIYRANLAFQAVFVPPGRYDLVMTFAPPFFPWILLLVPIGILIAGSASTLPMIRRRSLAVPVPN